MATRTEPNRAAGQMAEARVRFPDSLAPDQRAKSMFQYMDGVRVLYYLI